MGDTRKLRRKDVAPARPERDASLVPASQAAVAVELNLVEPLLTVGDVLDGEGIHWLDKLDGGGVGGVVSSCFHLKLV